MGSAVEGHFYMTFQSVKNMSLDDTCAFGQIPSTKRQKNCTWFAVQILRLCESSPLLCLRAAACITSDIPNPESDTFFGIPALLLLLTLLIPLVDLFSLSLLLQLDFSVALINLRQQTE